MFLSRVAVVEPRPVNIVENTADLVQAMLSVVG